jgi:hypothetical protein
VKDKSTEEIPKELMYPSLNKEMWRKADKKWIRDKWVEKRNKESWREIPLYGETRYVTFGEIYVYIRLEEKECVSKKKQR